MGSPPKPAAKAAEDDAVDQELRFKFRGGEYRLVGFDELTYKEIEVLEDAFDKPIQEIDTRRALAQRWAIFISLQRAGVDLSFDDLGQIRFIGDIEDPDAIEGPTGDAEAATA